MNTFIFNRKLMILKYDARVSNVEYLKNINNSIKIIDNVNNRYKISGF